MYLHYTQRSGKISWQVWNQAQKQTHTHQKYHIFPSLFWASCITIEIFGTAVDSNHSFPKPSRNLSQFLGVIVVCDSLNYGSGSFCWIAGFEDSRAHKNSIYSHLHHQSCICWCGHPTSSKIHNRQPTTTKQSQETRSLAGPAAFFQERSGT